MKTILVPTDFSKAAANALNYALEIASRTGATVHLLHVMAPTEGVNNSVYEIFWMDDYIKARRESLSQLGRRALRKQGLGDVAIQAEVRLGYPLTEILQYGKEIKADLIVMGTTGTTGLKQVFLGSTTAAVFGKVRIPVLAVPAKGAFRSGGRFALATDFHLQLDAASLAVLKELLDVHDTGLTVVHIAKKPKDMPDHRQEEQFMRKIDGLKPDFHYLEGENVPQEVGNFLEAAGANGLIAVSHDHSLLHRLFSDSVTRQLAHRVHVPMLVLHDKQR
jgi:nucleotide-binding universal stress UspA family protein